MKKFFVVVFVVILLGIGYFVFTFSRSAAPKDTSYDPGYVSGKVKTDANGDSSVPLVSTTPIVSDPTDKEQITPLYAIKHSLSQIDWGKEESDSMEIAGKLYQGTSIKGAYQSSSAGVSDFGEKGSLLQAGWNIDNALSAGGANGNAWGYTMDAEGGKQLLYFSYTNVSFTPPPGETKCPCAFQVKVFYSNSF